MLVQQGGKSEIRSFWADAIEDGAGMFAACLDWAAKYEEAQIFHYGSYERHAFRRAAEQYGLECRSSSVES